MIKITSMEKKGHTELVSSSLKLIAGEIGKRRQFFRLLAELKPYTNNHKYRKYQIFSAISIMTVKINA